MEYEITPCKSNRIFPRWGLYGMVLGGFFVISGIGMIWGCVQAKENEYIAYHNISSLGYYAKRVDSVMFAFPQALKVQVIK